MSLYSHQEILEANILYHEMFTDSSATSLYQEGIKDYLNGDKDTPSATFFIKVQRILDIAYLSIDKSRTE